MRMQSGLTDELRRITAILLQPEDDFGELTGAIEGLYQLFLKCSGFEKEEEKNREDIHLANGKAIGPFWAAQCIKESLRTKRFLQGIFLAIQDALQRFPARPIHLVYAGTGPFATLALPFTTVFSPDQVKWTFLEINPASIQCLQRVITAFEVGDFIKGLIECDATTYQIDPDDPVHIVVSETMQNALQKEPQVAIALNLIPQLVEGGIMIPQNVRVETALLDNEKNLKRMTSLNGFEEDYYMPLGMVFELNMETPKNTRSNIISQSPFVFPQVEIGIPQETYSHGQQLCLFTTIQVFEAVKLLPWQCSLTMPQMIGLPAKGDRPIDKMLCVYRMGQVPGFEFEFF